MDPFTGSSRFDFVENPYFSLPDPALLDGNDALSLVTRSIKTIYGKVELMTDRKQSDFLLRLMAHSDIKPNFEAMAASLGLPNEGAVKQRFKSLCEMNKFKFEDDKVEATDAVPDFDKVTLPAPTGDDHNHEDFKPETPQPQSKRKRAYKRKAKPAPAEVGDGGGAPETPDSSTKKKQKNKMLAQGNDDNKKAVKARAKTSKVAKKKVKQALSPEKVVEDEQVLGTAEDDGKGENHKAATIKAEGTDGGGASISGVAEPIDLEPTQTVEAIAGDAGDD